MWLPFAQEKYVPATLRQAGSSVAMIQKKMFHCKVGIFVTATVYPHPLLIKQQSQTNTTAVIMFHLRMFFT